MKKIVILALALGFIIGCKKKPENPVPPGKYDQGVLVLNEGLFEQNNASLSFYDGTTAYQQVFLAENGRGLGDTANDFETYSLDGKDYVIIAVDISSQIEIVERQTLKSVAQIPLINGSNAREPRRVRVFGSKAFVCNFDGTVAVIDLVSYSVVGLIDVGANPDGMAVVDNRLYVSNSGGLNFPVYDSTVSVIDMASNTVVDEIHTRINCNQMVVDGQGEIYLVSNGNYDDVAPALVRISTVTNTVLDVYEMSASSLSLYMDWLYFYDGDAEAIKRWNTLTEMVDPTWGIDVSHFDTFYGLKIDPITERIYGLDANGYVNSSTITAYSLSGNWLFEFKAGINAKALIFN